MGTLPPPSSLSWTVTACRIMAVEALMLLKPENSLLRCITHFKQFHKMYFKNFMEKGLPLKRENAVIGHVGPKKLLQYMHNRLINQHSVFIFSHIKYHNRHQPKK